MATKTIDTDYIWNLALDVKKSSDRASAIAFWRNELGELHGFESPQCKRAEKKVTKAATEVFTKQIALLRATANWPSMYDEVMALVYGEDIEEIYANKECG